MSGHDVPTGQSQGTGLRWIDEAFFRCLERLAFRPRGLSWEQDVGEQRSGRRGRGTDFSGFRSYVEGDDLRDIDWRVYGRLGHPVVRVHRQEASLAVHLLLDASLSMKGAQGRKWDLARRISAGLAYVAYQGLHRIGLALFADSLLSRIPPQRGHQALRRVLESLDRCAPEGTTDLNRSLRRYGESALRPGLAVVITDGWDASGIEEGVGYLVYKGYELRLIHLVDSQEVRLLEPGDWRITDPETGLLLEGRVDGRAAARFGRELDAHFERIRAFCRARSVVYLAASTDEGAEEVLLRFFGGESG